MTIFLASGFESGSLLEATATSNAAITTSAKFTGDRGCQLTSGGYVSYTTSIPLDGWVPMFNIAIMQASGTGTISCIKITTPSHYYEAKAVSTGGIYGMEFHRDGTKVTPSSETTLPSTFLVSNQWERITLYLTLTTAYILVNGRTVVKAPFSDSILSTSVTQVRVTAGTSTMYVDDITAFSSDLYSQVFDNYTPPKVVEPIEYPVIYSVLSTDIDEPEITAYHLAVIPLRPRTDTMVALTPIGASTQNADTVNDLEIGDTAYVKSTGVSTTTSDTYIIDSLNDYIETNMTMWKGYIGTRIDSSGNRLESPFVVGAYIHFASRQTVGNDVYVQCTIDADGTYIQSDQELLTTAYQVFGTPVDVTPENMETTLKVQLDHIHGTTSREIRTTSVAVYALALIEQSSTVSSSDDSYKVSFDIAASVLNTGSVIIGSNIQVAPVDQSLANLQIHIYASSNQIFVSAKGYPASWSMIFPTYFPSTENTHVEIIYHTNFVSIYFNSRWVHTFSFVSTMVPDSIELTASSSATATITNVVIREISDWREAIWIEYETSGDAAIQSIIQERPIIKAPSCTGGISYYLNHPESASAIPVENVAEHGYNKQYLTYAGSDGLVYYTDVKSVTNSTALEEVGFHTSVLQLSSLDSGAIRAAKIILDRSLESMIEHSVDARLDLRVEIGDLVSISYTATGIGESEGSSIYVQSKSISLTNEGGARMQIAGRQLSRTPDSDTDSSIDDIILEIS